MSCCKDAFLNIALPAMMFLMSCLTVDAENFGYIPSNRVYLGAGFNPLLPNSRPDLCIVSKGECQTSAFGAIACLSDQQPNADSQDFGMATNFKVKQVNSKYEFFREVNLQASLSGSYGPFSGSGSFSSYSLDDVREDSLTWIVVVRGSYGSFSLIRPALSPEARNLKPLDLIGKCGTGFVSEVEKGVLAAAIFSIYNLDELHKREIQATMSAGFSAGSWGADANATFASAMKTALTYGTMNINVYTMGGPGPRGLAELIRTTPTDLDNVRKILTEYVTNQGPRMSAIVGFSTTGFGKLTNNPSIDPDYTNFVYFFERANEYRLTLLDGLTKLNGMLARQLDYPADQTRVSKERLEKVNCEIDYVEQAMQACRMSYELSGQILSNGDARDDQTASIAQRYGITSQGSKRLPACSVDTATTESATATRPQKTFLSLGWALPTANQATSAANDCKSRRDAMKSKMSAMVDSALKASEAGGAACIAACEFDQDGALLAELRRSPSEPFTARYWFDALGGGFGSTNSPGLYVILEQAEVVKAVSAFNDEEAQPFGIRTASKEKTITLFFNESGLKANATTPVKLVIETVNGSVYVVHLPKIKLI